MRQSTDRIALGTSLIYAAISGLWILLSDRALEFFWSDHATIAHLQTYKALVFVAATAGCLYLGLRAQLRHRGRESIVRMQSEEARDRSLSLMTATLESTADGILVVNREGKIETFNRLFTGMWRLPDEILAMKDDDRAVKWVLDQLAEPEKFLEKVRYLYDHPEEESFDQLQFKDGRLFERYSRPQLIAGQVVGRVWSFRDITERRRAETELREKQTQLLEALRIARLAYWEYDVLADQFHFNDQFYAILRTTAEREGGYTMSSAHYAGRFVHPEDMAVVGNEIAQALSTTDPNFRREIEHRITYADGEIGYFAVHVRIRKDAAGRTVQTYGANMDVTPHKRAEGKVRHLANFPELNPNPVLEFTPEGKMVYHNPAAVSMALKVGIPNLADLLPPAAPQIVAECLATNQSRLRLETRHGSHTLSWSFYPIAAQRVVHCYVGDITERHHLEAQLRQAQKMEAIGQLAGGVAHDFNNLLTAIVGHLGLLRPNPQVTPEMAESLDEIAAAASRAANLTNQLLAFSRRQVISVAALDLNEVVTHLTKMLRRVLGEDIAMQVDYAPERLTFQGDAGMIDQVLLNLAVNARDAMPGGGTLRIVTQAVTRRTPDGAGQHGRFVHLTVSDTGAGISPEVLPRIFEPFFTTKDVGKGTGLGLATVFGIVQQHHGSIDVESTVGRGTTFHVYLPRIQVPAAPPAVEVPELPARGRGETILLVEDEPAVREVGIVTLRRYGYRVLTAASGREAVDIWAAHEAEISLLLTDLIMPGGVSGLQLARRLLAEKPDLRVVYTSGYSAETAGKELPLKDGINYLAKPYDLDQLFRTVRNALDREPSRPPF